MCSLSLFLLSSNADYYMTEFDNCVGFVEKVAQPRDKMVFVGDVTLRVLMTLP
jgi:hypothetical protein